MLIVPGIMSLSQYLLMLVRGPILDYHQEQCRICGKIGGLWGHGFRFRKSDREGEGLNPIKIQRLICKFCKKTFSILPECIPPRRWHLWAMQQAALLLYVSGRSIRAIAKTLSPARRTISRWLTCLKEEFLVHESVLRGHQPDLGRASGFTDFWKACLDKFSLASAMRLCHVAGVVIP